MNKQEIDQKVPVNRRKFFLTNTSNPEDHGYSREQVLERMASQLPEEEKIRKADVVIYNDGTLEDLRNKVADALNK